MIPTTRDPSAVLPAACPCDTACSAVALLVSAIQFIERVDDRVFSMPSCVLPGGTIGKHLRHAVDHFAAVLVPVRESFEPSSIIDYDRRERNVPMESCRQTAMREMETLIADLAAITGEVGSRPVMVRVMLTSDGQEADLRSTLARELAFAAHHAVHHHAMMLAIAREHGLPVNDDFAKAPSTLRHERATSYPTAR